VIQIVTLCWLAAFHVSTERGITIQEEITHCENFEVEGDPDTCDYDDWFQCQVTN
jgi:hypothetical protein